MPMKQHLCDGCKFIGGGIETQEDGAVHPKARSSELSKDIPRYSSYSKRQGLGRDVWSLEGKRGKLGVAKFKGAPKPCSSR